MFTAKDIHILVKQSKKCDNIDYWIEYSLAEQFVKSPYKAFVAATILRINNWTQDGFIESMSERGFSVTFVTDQRDGDFYTITYPPQEH